MQTKKYKQDQQNFTNQGIGFGILSLILVAVIFWLTVWHKEWFMRFSPLGYLGLFVSNFLASSAIILPVPTMIGSFMSGNILNPVLVGVFSGLGSALGDFLAFILGFGARRVINKFIKKEVLFGRLETFFKKNAFLAIFIFSFIPNPVFDGVGLISGALNIKARDFFLATLLGRVLRNVLIALTGDRILK